MTMFNILLEENPIEHIMPQKLFTLFGLEVNNHMLAALVTAIIMLLIFPAIFRKVDDQAPHGAKNLFESIMEFLRIEVFRPALKENTERFLPFLWTLFFFILINNLLASIPFGDILVVITRNPELAHWGGGATGNISTTAVLALCTFIMVHFSGIKQVADSLRNGTYGHHGHHEEHSSDGNSPHEAAHDLEHSRADALPADVTQNLKALGNPTPHYNDDKYLGHGSGVEGSGAAVAAAPQLTMGQAMLKAVPLYLWNFAPHIFRPEEGAPLSKWIPDILMWFILLLLELIGAIIKPFALTMRLFANMIAGHLVLAVLVSLIVVFSSISAQVAVGVPVTVLGLMIRVLEVFVAFLQSYIFVFLTTLFIASAVAPEH